jgi:hypothetical protein
VHRIVYRTMVWSRFGKFVSQTYHCINPKTFEYHAMLLDLIPFNGLQFAETMAGALRERQENWTRGATNDLLLSSAIADAESKGQAAGKLIVGDDDQLKCQNHKLKKVYEVGETNSGQYLLDFTAFAALCSSAASRGNVVDVLSNYQFLNDLCALDFVNYNDTRWEGRYAVISRAVHLELSMVMNSDLHRLPVVQEQRLIVHDFLEAIYFARLKSYKIVLKNLNDVSKCYQTQSFPVGCFVPLLNHYMYECCASNTANESGALVAMKNSFAAAIKQYLVQPVVSECNNFLKSAMFHPGVLRMIQCKNIVDVDVLNKCWNSSLKVLELVLLWMLRLIFTGTTVFQ